METFSCILQLCVFSEFWIGDKPPLQNQTLELNPAPPSKGCVICFSVLFS